MRIRCEIAWHALAGKRVADRLGAHSLVGSVGGTAPLVGQAAGFVAAATLSGGPPKNVTDLATWSSSDPSIATVSSWGLVTGIADGEVDVIATHRSVTGKSHITVRRPTGTFTGRYTITRCTNTDPPDLIPFKLCGQVYSPQSYKFTLAESGGTVTGTYQLLDEFGYNWCPCPTWAYGTVIMSGTVAPDGTLSTVATGALGSGVDGQMTFTLRRVTPTTLGGTVDAILTVGVQRATFSGTVTGS